MLHERVRSAGPGAAAAGDPARFRRAVDTTAPEDLQRDERGFPLDWKERQLHISARTEFGNTMITERPTEWAALIRKYDTEDPGYYVEWQRLKVAEREAREGRNSPSAAA